MDILPDNITLKILGYLGWKERIRKEIICKKWKQLLKYTYLQSNTDIELYINGIASYSIYFTVKYKGENIIPRSVNKRYYDNIFPLLVKLDKIPFGSVIIGGFDNSDLVKPLFKLMKDKCRILKISNRDPNLKVMKNLSNVEELYIGNYTDYIESIELDPYRSYWKNKSSPLNCSDLATIILFYPKLKKLYLHDKIICTGYVKEKVERMWRKINNNPVTQDIIREILDHVNVREHSCYSLLVKIIKKLYGIDTISDYDGGSPDNILKAGKSNFEWWEFSETCECCF